MSEALLVAKGVNGQLTLFEDQICIGRKGLISFMSQGLKGDKSVALSSITSIQWRDAGLLANGYIQFAFMGGAEAKGGLFQATQDENSVMFSRAQQGEFQTLRDALQVAIKARSATSTPPSSVADELKKFAVLRDQGVLTASEFEAKKKQLLGI